MYDSLVDHIDHKKIMYEVLYDLYGAILWSDYHQPRPETRVLSIGFV